MYDYISMDKFSCSLTFNIENYNLSHIYCSEEHETIQNIILKP